MEEVKLYTYDYEKPDISDVIEHYGVKGMRWGVRKTYEKVHDWRQKKNQEAIARREAKGKKQTKRQFYIANYEKQYKKDKEKYYNKYKNNVLVNPLGSHLVATAKASKMARSVNRRNTNVEYYKKIKGYGKTRANLAETGSRLLRNFAKSVATASIGAFTGVGIMMNYRKGNGSTFSYAEAKNYAKGNRRAVANYALNKTVDLMKKVKSSKMAKQKMKDFAKNSIKIGAKPIVDANWRYV